MDVSDTDNITPNTSGCYIAYSNTCVQDNTAIIPDNATSISMRKIAYDLFLLRYN